MPNSKPPNNPGRPRKAQPARRSPRHPGLLSRGRRPNESRHQGPRSHALAGSARLRRGLRIRRTPRRRRLQRALVRRRLRNGANPDCVRPSLQRDMRSRSVSFALRCGRFSTPDNFSTRQTLRRWEGVDRRRCRCCVRSCGSRTSSGSIASSTGGTARSAERGPRHSRTPGGCRRLRRPSRHRPRPPPRHGSRRPFRRSRRTSG